jgi:C1A family cysteine protease
MKIINNNTKAMVIAVAMTIIPINFAQAEALSSSPLNPEFIKYTQNPSSYFLQNPTADGHGFGYIPPPIKIPKESVLSKTSLGKLSTTLSTKVLPATFDLRKLGGVTSVKNQGPCGSCWAFASYASLESFLKYKGGPRQTFNFSEADLNQYHGFDYRECMGGNFIMATAYLARWSGPVDDEDVPYPYVSMATPGVAVNKHVQNVWFIPDRAAPGKDYNTTVKTAIQTYGAVYVMFKWDDSDYNKANAAYYYTTMAGENHAVAIIGWDDNYSKTKFNVQPPGNGAFLVKNSWGSTWGKAGYFYMSYYDKSLQIGALFYNAEVTTKYNHAYEYDPLGWVTSMGWRRSSAKFANIFMASSNATNIKAVSIYTPVPNSSYQLSIYKDVVANKPETGTLVKTLNGTIVRPGYNTIPTYATDTVPPAVTGGKRFSIVMTLTTPGDKNPVPIELPQANYSSAANAYAGQSFLFRPYGTWNDLTKLKGYEKANISMKAFGD